MKNKMVPKGDLCYTWIEKPNRRTNKKGILKLCPYWEKRKDKPNQKMDIVNY
jgi:hypothetical protein